MGSNVYSPCASSCCSNNNNNYNPYMSINNNNGNYNPYNSLPINGNLPVRVLTVGDFNFFGFQTNTNTGTNTNVNQYLPYGSQQFTGTYQNGRY